MKKEIPLDLKNLKGVNSENLRKDYPSEFFNIDFYNNISFVIYKHLNLAFENNLFFNAPVKYAQNEGYKTHNVVITIPELKKCCPTTIVFDY